MKPMAYSTSSANGQFPLLELPKDVRNRIYRYTLFHRGLKTGPRPHFSATSTWFIPIPPLLQTCTTIRNEALGTYYKEFSVSARTIRDVIPWLQTLDERARAALGVVIAFGWDWDKLPEEKSDETHRYNHALGGLRNARVLLRREQLRML